MRSAYAVWGEPQCTSFHSGFQGTVDYILFDHARLKLATLMPVPPIELIAQHGSLPDHVTPSDHLPIAADFEWQAMPQSGTHTRWNSDVDDVPGVGLRGVVAADGAQVSRSAELRAIVL